MKRLALHAIIMGSFKTILSILDVECIKSFGGMYVCVWVCVYSSILGGRAALRPE